MLCCCTWVAGAKTQEYASKDGRFFFPLAGTVKNAHNPAPSSMLTLLAPDQKVMVVVTRVKPVSKSVQQLLQEVPHQTPWVIRASHAGKVGSQPAAVFFATQVLKPDPSKDTVIALVPAPFGLYVFQIHYPKTLKPADFEAWLVSVRWK